MRKLLLFLLCVVIGGGSVPARALEVVATPENEFIASAPVMITGYQTTSSALNLAAVEVYNAGDKPVDMAQWQLVAVLKDTTSQTVNAPTTYTGLLVPGEHVTYSASSKTTFGLQLARQVSAIVSIELHYIGTDTVYKPATALIKDQTDVPFFRSYTTTGYSTAAQPFLAAPVRAFYDDGLYQAPKPPTGLKVIEIYPYASDCAPNDTSVLCGDYIKLLNTTDSDLTVDDLVLRTDSSSSTRTTSNTFSLAGTINAHSVLTLSKTDDGARISLTNSGGYVWLEDAWGLARYDDTITQYGSAGVSEQGYAYATTQDGTWVWTTTPQPLGANVITQAVVVVAECPDGKYRNPDTGRCRTIEEAVNAMSTCEEGYERNPLTNRCRKIAETAAATATPCLEGQERNPVTNRCRSIATAVAELLPCEEGYERNPDTHRCRKVSSADMPNAAFPVVPVKAATSDMAGWWAFGVVMVIALGYGFWEWRMEIAGLARRALGIFTRSK